MPAMAAPKSKTQSPWKQFAISIGLVVLLFISALFAGIYFNSQRAIERELRSRAEALFNSIVLTRAWNARYGGVFVEKKPGIESNPYLVDPDITAGNGKTYTRKNPALMTREISEIALGEGAFQFHITSLKPLNPNNNPDAFEREALLSFANGKREAIGKEKNGDAIYYRYMAPLIVEQSCLDCHAVQGYKLGDIRGGISVRFNIDDMMHAQTVQRVLFGLLFSLTLVSLLGIVYYLTSTLQKKLLAAELLIREMVITDELTQLKNRRYLLKRLQEELERASRYRHPLSVIFFDVDHFKRVNDSHGHDAGDEVLRMVSAAALGQCRQTDLLARYGGEEFVMLLPETTLEQARVHAERLRRAIERQHCIVAKSEISVTVTLGVACYAAETSATTPDAQDFIKQADMAMFTAKEAGRNRVGVAS